MATKRKTSQPDSWLVISDLPCDIVDADLGLIDVHGIPIGDEIELDLDEENKRCRVRLVRGIKWE